MKCTEGDVPDNAEQVVSELGFSIKEDHSDSYELESHTLMIRAEPFGQTFGCLHCKVNYESAEDFNLAHNIASFATMDESDVIEEPLWLALPDDVVVPEELVDSMNEAKELQSKQLAEHNKYRCVKCDVVFDTLNLVEEHQCMGNCTENVAPETLNEISELGCQLCGGFFPTLQTFQEHQIISTNCKNSEPLIVQVECTVCGRSFLSSQQLNIHMTTHKENQEFICDICNTTFGAERYLISHKKMHDQRPVRSIEQALPAKLKKNYRQNDQFYCELCEKSFDSTLLLVHKNMHLTDKKELAQNTCTFCNREFFTTETYEIHMAFHAGQTLHKLAQNEQDISMTGRFKCQFCDKVFKRAYEKVSHERVHTGEKPYACEVCGKRFRVSYSLTVHLRTHSDVRSYECEICYKSFKSQSVLAHHKRIHSSERIFKCDQCEKTFATSVQLSGHRNTHFKPFICTICNRSFAALYVLRSHMHTHHSEAAKKEKAKQFQTEAVSKPTCHICGATYVRNSNLRHHFKTQHGVKQTKNKEFISTEPNSHESEEMDRMGAHFLAEREEVIEVQEYVQDETVEVEPVDEQAALLIAVANAAEQFQQQQPSYYNNLHNNEDIMPENMYFNYLEGEVIGN